MSFNIKKRREKLGLTLEEVGRFVGVSKGTVAKWESGFIKNMRRDKIIKLAEILHTSPLDFLSDNTADPNTLIQEKVPLCGELKNEYTHFILSVFDTLCTEPMVLVFKDNHLILANPKSKSIQSFLNNF